MTELQKHLVSIRVCQEAREWAGNRTPDQAWDECDSLDQLVWWKARTADDRVPLCRWLARMWREQCEQHLPQGVTHSQTCIATMERWCGDPTPENMEDLRVSSRAAVRAAVVSIHNSAAAVADAATYTVIEAAIIARAGVYAAVDVGAADYASAFAYAAAYVGIVTGTYIKSGADIAKLAYRLHSFRTEFKCPDVSGKGKQGH